LARQKGGHRYTLFILIDTRDDSISYQQFLAFHSLRTRAPYGIPFHYRLLAENTHQKILNLPPLITRLGGAPEAKVVLAADSLMTRRAIDHLGTALSFNRYNAKHLGSLSCSVSDLYSCDRRDLTCVASPIMYFF
ncbi:MAG: hypothetical protein ACFB2W_22195, partial [Leptolyngbyaceae cyanobacterium]